MKAKAIIYCRVSSREQEETGYSLEAQEKFLVEYANEKDLNVVKIYKVTESASKWQLRKTLNEMLDYATKHSIKVILCEKIDRLTRSLKDAGIVDDWINKEKEREVHFAKEHFILSVNTKSHDNLVWDMKVAIARFYTNNLSEEVKKGQKEKISQGWLPSSPPIGYKSIGEKGHKIHIIDPDTAPSIKKMFELYATRNYSMKAILDLLYEEGFRTSSGKRMAKSRIEDILSNPFYYGAMVWNDELYPKGSHTPLISKELFDQVRDIRMGKKTPNTTKHKFQFRKMFICGECGGTITAEIQKGIIYYHCNHYRQCSQKAYTTEKKLEEKLFGVFKFFENITSEEAEVIKEKIKANHAQEIEYKENTIRNLNERYGSLQRRLDNLYNDRLDDRISPDFWETKHKEIVAEQEAVTEAMNKMKTDEAKYFEIWLNIIDLARRAKEIYERRSPEERRVLLSHIFSNLILKDNSPSYILKTPVQKLAERVQERLDCEKIFERKKALRHKTKDSFSTEISTQLRR